MTFVLVADRNNLNFFTYLNLSLYIIVINTSKVFLLVNQSLFLIFYTVLEPVKFD